MKKYFFSIGLVFLTIVLLAGCKSKTADRPEHLEEGVHQEEKKILYYTCSMHPFIRQNEPGQCPVCGMTLVPKYAEGEETEPQPSAAGRSPVKIDAAKRQLIGVATEEAKTRPLVREIDVFGRVAFDPDLYVAQADYLVARRTGGGGLGELQSGLVRSARARLELLGMSEAQIRDLEKSGRAQGGLVVPRKDEGVWLYGSVFESDLPWIRSGTPVTVEIPGTGKTLTGSVASLSPTIDPDTRTAQIRVHVSNSEGGLRPGLFVKLKLDAGGEEVLALPGDALIDTGKRKLVYVETGPGTFEPREVTTGRYGTAYVEILSGLGVGEKVVTRGNFLIDSESSLKAAHANGGGGHQH
jgi:Cu(I)/Ag(I) efflux system membrane fusion protein